MRVDVREPGSTEEGPTVGRRDFSLALDRARRADEAAGRGRARTAAGDRRDALDRGAHLLRERRAGFDDRERAAPPARGGAAAEHPPPPALRGGQGGPVPASDPAAGFAPGVHAPALRAAIRALPAAAEVVRARAGDRLELAFGRALSIELRAARGGVEIVLRPEAGLAREAAAELPALVRALRDRGMAVARAEVRRRGGRVDDPSALR